jgi:hypothetical protein
VQRWWAPQRATVEPDQVVLAMLEPGELGSAVLAVHRAGAAAIDTLRNGMVSEAGLVDVLSSCRALVAGQVVDSVAKNLEPSYAGLLVSDVFDDAEQGAVSLYRTAVNKGVAPSIAVVRVSDVFGVPSSLMGRYQLVATDPKTSPATSRDLADRTLLEYVAKLVEVEASPVSKAVATADWDESEVNRDAEGRFAPENARRRVGTLEYTREQLGLTGVPAEIAGTPTKPVAPKRPKRLQRIQRVKRVKRAKPSPDSRSKPGTTASRTATRQASRQASSQATRQAERQATSQALNQAASEALERGASQSAGARARAPQLTGDMLAPFDQTDEYRPLYSVESLVLRTTLQEGHAFRQVLKDQSGRFRDKSTRAFRVGHFQDTVSRTDPERPGLMGDDDARKGVAAIVKAPAEAYQAATGLQWLDKETLRDTDVLAWSGMTAKDVLEERARRQNSKITWAQGPDGTWTQDPVEMQHAFVLPVYTPFDNEDETDEWALVHFNAPAPDGSGNRVEPTVEEFVLLGTPTGHIEEAFGRTWDEISLDPNAVYEIVPPPYSAEGTLPVEERFWDKQNQVMVNRWYLRQVDEDELPDRLGDVGKADTHTFRETDVLRDEAGRFAEEPDTTSTTSTKAPEVVRPSRPQRLQRIQRVKRLKRVKGTAGVRDAPQSVRQAGRTASSQATRQAVHQAFHQAVHQAMRQAEAYLGIDPDALDESVLSAHHGYKVLSQQQWNDAVQFTGKGQTELERHGKEITLNSLVRQSLVGHESLRAENVPFKMAMVLNNDPKLDQVPSVIAAYLHMSEATLDNVANKVAEIFKNNPKAAKVEIIRRENVLTFSIPERNPAPQVLLEVDPETDWSKPVTISYVGKFRGRDMKVLTDAGIESLVSSVGNATEKGGFEGIVANPDIVYYRIVSKHWRAGN